MKTIWQFAMVGVLVACSSTSAVSDPLPEVTRGNIQSLTIAQLRTFLWPNGDAPEIVDKNVNEDQNLYSMIPYVQLFGPPNALNARICQRAEYWARIDYPASTMPNSGQYLVGTDFRQFPIVSLGPPYASTGLAFAPNCALHPDQTFVQLERAGNRFLDKAAGISALELLNHVHREANVKSTVDFPITCKTLRGPERCVGTPQQTLANMPIHLVWEIKQDTPNSFVYWINKPNSLIWDVKISTDSSGKPVSVAIESYYPYPF
jgi:hypothetical protein